MCVATRHDAMCCDALRGIGLYWLVQGLCVIMACLVMAYVVMAYILMACVVIDYVVMAYIARHVSAVPEGGIDPGTACPALRSGSIAPLGSGAHVVEPLQAR